MGGKTLETRGGGKSVVRKLEKTKGGVGDKRRGSSDGVMDAFRG